MKELLSNAAEWQSAIWKAWANDGFSPRPKRASA